MGSLHRLSFHDEPLRSRGFPLGQNCLNFSFQHRIIVSYPNAKTHFFKRMIRYLRHFFGSIKDGLPAADGKVDGTGEKMSKIGRHEDMDREDTVRRGGGCV